MFCCDLYIQKVADAVNSRQATLLGADGLYDLPDGAMIDSGDCDSSKMNKNCIDDCDNCTGCDIFLIGFDIDLDADNTVYYLDGLTDFCSASDYVSLGFSYKMKYDNPNF